VFINNINDWQQLFTLSVGLTNKTYSQFLSSRRLSANCLSSSLWHICHHSKPHCHIIRRLPQNVSACRLSSSTCQLPRIPFQQWLAHV